jgi:peptidoglycan hydrolase CwlO-like protein
MPALDTEGVPLPIAPEKSGFFKWPSPKALVFWLGLLGTIAVVGSVVGGAFFVKAEIYAVDKAAQQSVNATVDSAQKVVTVRLDALKAQVDDARMEQKEQTAKIDSKLDRLLERRSR